MELQEEDNPNVRKIVFVGLDNAGKTSIILSLLREISKVVLIKPTRNVERRTFEFLGMNISEWDLGGHERYRKLYLEKAESIFRGVDILIYVVDIQDNDRIFESFIYLKSIIKKMIEINLIPPIYVFFHKNDPDITKSIQFKINDTISFLKSKIKDFPNCERFSFYKTSIFELSSITNAISEILLSLYPRSKVLDTAIIGYVNKCGAKGLELIDDNSLIISSYYKSEEIKELLNSLSPYFLKLNDGFKNLENIKDKAENQMIVERFGKYFIFKQFTLIEGVSSYYILLCTDDPFLNEFDFNALIDLLRDIISHAP